MPDRRIHAKYADMEIVRYDRAGKWYLEPTFSGLKRQHVTIAVAALSAKWGIQNAGGTWYPGLPGGSGFDVLMRSSG